ncbi:unnamed protein product [Cylindrotheca closterium]|uniref:Pseudouridine synthase RsuA/RluA-like domain-containing protein n=1 Tax=Cylindrotheca closterium TaxID=2856 RepID=A0AAD2CUA3_9STRA|nr:unnamed protein product [Cylindrotheca closterium]
MRRHGAAGVTRHFSTRSSQPAFYWPSITNNNNNANNNDNSIRSISTGPVEATFSNELFYSHVLIKEDGLSMLEAIDASVGHVLDDHQTTNGDDIDASLPTKVQKLTPFQLLQLGSVWYMPREEVDHNNNRKPEEPHSLIYKPQRLSFANHTMSLQAGDYLRIHHTPRRFIRVYDQDWREFRDDENKGNPRIVRTGNGFYIIDKPPLVPVHATVDNDVENVAHQLEFHNPHQDYVATTQRIDINTSGLLAVATKPEFAAYFSSLLRRKTKNTLKQEQLQDKLANSTEDSVTNSASPSRAAVKKNSNIEKEYKCLVCIQETDSSSAVDSWQTLKNLEESNSVVRHFLEGSDRAPKRFEDEIPPQEEDDDDQSRNPSKWYECLLQVKRVSPLIPMETADCPLAQSLWSQQVTTSVPERTRGVCEVSIQLLTGRTHQIRGQLAKLGYPIVGDEQYGGAIPKQQEQQQQEEDSSEHAAAGTILRDEFAQLLALQCCHLGFWDADYKPVWHKKKRREILEGRLSDRWISVTLDSAWWTEYIAAAAGKSLSSTDTSSTTTATTSAADVELVQQQKDKQRRLGLSLVGDDEEFANARVDLLPPTVQLSQGANKYVLIKVDGKDDKIHWFVVSASPSECGGPYHVNVAEDTMEWIRAAGFQRITVTGGGRIDFNPDSGRAHVYGFSYGFGKGDHAKAAELIDAYYKENETDVNVKASFDDSDRLY